MTKPRYGCSTVRDKKNVLRTLNNFSEQYKYIFMEISPTQVYTFSFEEDIAYTLNENIVFDSDIALTTLTTTENILIANNQMFEHKPFQPYIKQIIQDLSGLVKINGKVYEGNTFFTQEKKEDMIILFYDRLEKLSGKKLSERFVKKLYTTLRNRTLYPFLYSSDYLSSKSPTLKLTTSLHQNIQSHYQYYEKYKWIINHRHDFKHYYHDIAIEGRYSPTAQEWYDFMSFMMEHNIEDRLLNSVRFIGKLIAPYVLQEDIAYFPDYINLGFIKKNGLQSFISEKGNLQGMKHKRYIDYVLDEECQNYRERGKIHFSINKIIPLNIQMEIYYFYIDIEDNAYESVLDFKSTSNYFHYTHEDKDDSADF